MEKICYNKYEPREKKGIDPMNLLTTFILLNIANVIIQTVKSIATIKCGKTAAAVVNAVAGADGVVEKAAEVAPIYWNYGAFIQQCIDFLILAFCVFLMVKMMNKLIKKEEAKPAAPAPAPAPSKEEVLLTEIRDLLKEKK